MQDFIYYGRCGTGATGGGVVVGGVVVGTPGFTGVVGEGTGLPGCCVGCPGTPVCGSFGLVGSGVTGGVLAGVVVCPLRALLLGALGLRRCSGVDIVLSPLLVGVRFVVVPGVVALLLLMVSVWAEANPKVSTAASV